jgi:hypothetical protein
MCENRHRILNKAQVWSGPSRFSTFRSRLVRRSMSQEEDTHQPRFGTRTPRRLLCSKTLWPVRRPLRPLSRHLGIPWSCEDGGYALASSGKTGSGTRKELNGHPMVNGEECFEEKWAGPRPDEPLARQLSTHVLSACGDCRFYAS